MSWEWALRWLLTIWLYEVLGFAVVCGCCGAVDLARAAWRRR